MAIFVNNATAQGHALLDRWLFLPEEWAADRLWRQEAGVPESVVFRPKPEF